MTESQANEACGAATPTRRVWGFGATAGFGLVIFATFIGVNVAISIAFTMMTLSAGGGQGDAGPIVADMYDGDLTAIAIILSALVCVPLVLGAAALRRRATLIEYFALRLPKTRHLVLWLGAGSLFMLGSDTLTRFLGKPIVPDVMVRFYQSADFPQLLWIAMVFGAPLFEEFFFRGFLLRGFPESKSGIAAGVAITSLLWAISHVQYGYYEIGTIFFLGLLMGTARHLGESLWICIFMHGFMNSVAAMQTAWYAM